MYTNTIDELEKTGNYTDMLLKFSEIPTLLELAEGKFRVSKKDVLMDVAVQTDDSIPSLQESLTETLRHSSSFLIMIGKICSAVFQSDNKYYFFDSHSQRRSGLADQYQFDNDTSIIIAFTAIDDLVNYCMQCTLVYL